VELYRKKKECSYTLSGGLSVSSVFKLVSWVAFEPSGFSLSL